MSNNTKSALASILMIVAAIYLGNVTAKPTIVVENNIPEQRAEAPTGAASPDISSPYFSYGGVRHWGATVSTLDQATTSICRIISPFSTSTLQVASVQITTGSTTPLVFEIAKSTLPSATTTRLLYASTTPGYPTFTAQTGVATTTTQEITTRSAIARTATWEDMIFAPNTYLTVKVGGAKGALNVLEGSCKATWVQN